MADLLEVSPLQGGAAALVVLVVVLVLTGRLVPRRILDDMRSERDTWRAAHTVSEEARRTAQGQVGELLEVARTADHFYRSLSTVGEVAAHAEHPGAVVAE